MVRGITIAVGLALVVLLVSKLPAIAQGMPDARQALQGLLTGNSLQDRALIEAFERGYRRGREDGIRAANESTKSPKSKSPAR
jgi:hypothetical protein